MTELRSITLLTCVDVKAQQALLCGPQIAKEDQKHMIKAPTDTQVYED